MSQQNQQVDDILAARKRRISFFCVFFLIVFLFLFLSIYFICIYTPSLVISEATMRITAPLTDDGQIDFSRYIAENFYPPELPTDENGYRLFVQKFGDVYLDNNFHKQQTYKKLNLDINVPPTMSMPQTPLKIVSNYYANIGQSVPNDIYDELSKTWTLEEFPMLKDWIDTIDEPLDAIAEMIHKPFFVSPPFENEDLHNKNKSQILHFGNHIQTCRDIVQLFSARAKYRIGQGDIDGAIDDIITIYQLGLHLKQDNPAFSVNILVGGIFENVASAIALDVNPEHPVNKKQLQRIAKTLEQLQTNNLLEKTIEMERILTLNWVQSVLNNYDRNDKNIIGFATDDKIFALLKYGRILSNTNIIYKQINETFDVFVGKNQHLKFTVHKSPPNNREIFWQMLTSYGRGQYCADAWVYYCSNVCDSIERIIQRCESMRNIKRLSLALMMYKIDSGELPKTDWVEKIKPYLGNNFEKYLHCLSSKNQDKGKTNYVLVLYDKLPADGTVLQLVELREPVPFDQAVMTDEEVLNDLNLDKKLRRIGYPSDVTINFSRQNGAVNSLPESMTNNKTTINKLVGKE
ncbi:MAG: hypothetical protein LBP59_12540 [Planctomycetaceae bacterium]|jgi:hypothetical protein|nr:hypothetical protein [Planctomycetaceae bacterium]